MRSGYVAQYNIYNKWINIMDKNGETIIYDSMENALECCRKRKINFTNYKTINLYDNSELIHFRYRKHGIHNLEIAEYIVSEFEAIGNIRAEENGINGGANIVVEDKNYIYRASITTDPLPKEDAKLYDDNYVLGYDMKSQKYNLNGGGYTDNVDHLISLIIEDMGKAIDLY